MHKSNPRHVDLSANDLSFIHQLIDPPYRATIFREWIIKGERELWDRMTSELSLHIYCKRESL